VLQLTWWERFAAVHSTLESKPFQTPMTIIGSPARHADKASGVEVTGRQEYLGGEVLDQQRAPEAQVCRGTRPGGQFAG